MHHDLCISNSKETNNRNNQNLCQQRIKSEVATQWNERTSLSHANESKKYVKLMKPGTKEHK